MMKRLLLAVAVVQAWLGLVVAGLGVAPLRAEPVFRIEKVSEAHLAGPPSGVTFVLAIGNDGRAGLDGVRGDALHLIGINPAAGRATMLNIPRDTYVDIPGRGRGRINEAFDYGGARLQAETVSAMTGIPIAFTVTTNFDGLARMVDELGGVDVDVPFAMDDSFSGAIFPQGRVHMDGESALAFSRNRHVPDGDIRRTEHQGILILAGLAKLRADPTPTATVKELAVLYRHSHVEGVGVRDLYRLGKVALAVDPANVASITPPLGGGRVGAAEVLFLGPDAGALFADMRDDAILQSR